MLRSACFGAGVLAGLAALSVVNGPAAAAETETIRVSGESVVLAGEEPATLCYEGVTRGSVTVRSTYEPGLPDTVVYEEGRDYVLDCEHGTVRRTPGSRIPDYTTNVLYGQKGFDHTQVPGFGNSGFFAWVDYTTTRGFPLTEETDQPGPLAGVRAKLERGGPFKLVAYGDSITAGGDASRVDLQFPSLYAAWLGQQFPKAQVTLENGATGGDCTVQGLDRLEEKVVSRAPDYVIVGFGMNDHNIGCVEPAAYEENLVTIVSRIKERTGADVLLFSTFPPNPDWKFGSGRMAQYAAATQRAAERTGSAYADLYAAWMRVLERKDCHSMLSNNINHPNDWGHALYARVLESVRF